MSEWFQAKVKFLRQMDNGLIKSITEQYLVDSMSFTETEARVMQEVGEGMRGVQAVAISRSSIKEVVMYGDTDQFFKVKVQYSMTDEETEKEKKVTTYLLVNANDPKEAYERTEEHLKEMLVPFRITKVEESPICEVYEHKSNERVGNHNSAGAYYDEELTEDQKNILKERACDAPKMDDVALFKGTPIMSLSEKERGFVRALLAHFCEFYSRPIKETTIDCPMEGDIEHLSTWNDPTSGQAVAFNVHSNLVDYLRSIGREEMTISELDEIDRNASKMLKGDFSFFMWSEFEFEREEGDAIWDILQQQRVRQ